jgi:nucleotide-binding universal stress UspA family protein
MTKNVTEREFRIIWAVDAGADLGLQKAAIASIKAVIKGRTPSVEPVYLLSTFLDSAPTQSFGDTLSLTEGAIRERFDKLTRKLKIPGLKPLTLLTGTDLSYRRMATELSEYAENQGANAILLASHGRKGINRWFLGSFADSMLQQPSKIPLLITNPHGNSATRFERILFPTDFSDESKVAFRKVIDFSRISGSRITLFHKISLTASPELHLMLKDFTDYKRIRRRAVADARAQATSWVREGGEHGVRVKVSIDAQGMPSVADAILNQQRRTAGLIALASHSGDATSLQMGTTTRAVVRGSMSAVWVLPSMVDHVGLAKTYHGSEKDLAA